MIEANEAPLQKVLHDLQDFLPKIVLVGGWLPFVYAKFLWENISERPITTADIDIAIRCVGTDEEGSISERLTTLHYPKKHLKFGKETPFAFLIKSEQDDVSVPLDLLCTQEEVTDIVKITGHDVIVSNFKGFNVLYEGLLTVEAYGLQMTIPSPERYIFYKLKTFTDRNDSHKKWKDLYYVCFIYQIHPDNSSLVAKIHELIKIHPWGGAINKNIKNYFNDVHDIGPLELAKQVSACEISLYMEYPLEKSVFEIIAHFSTES